MTPVTIIGAGPAGSVAAILLARAGWSVRLVEQHRFPRDKVCGECVSALGLESLRRIGILEKLRTLKPVTLRQATIHTVDGRQYRLPLSPPMWGLSRRALDQCLLDLAREAGVLVNQPARFEGLELNPSRVRVRDIESNRSRTSETGCLILADGKRLVPSRRLPTNDGALPSPSLGIPGEGWGGGSLERVQLQNSPHPGPLSDSRLSRGKQPSFVYDYGLKAHFEGMHGQRDTIELFGCRGLYGGLAPIENGRWNFAFSIPVQRLREHKGNLEGLFESLIAENRALEAQLRHATRVSDWLVAPLPRFGLQSDWPDRVIPVGNAAAAIEPIGGEGMGLAIRSAELVAQCLIEGGDVAWLRGEYERLWRTRRFACRTAALVISSPTASRWLLPLLDVAPAITNAALNLLGKPLTET